MTIEFNDEFVKDIGPGMLDGLTSKLYSNGTFVLREYISNSIDARAQNVHIKCKPPYDAIEISDDGRGFSKKNLEGIIQLLFKQIQELWAFILQSFNDKVQNQPEPMRNELLALLKTK